MQIEKKSKRHVQWDEQKLKQTEKLRGMFHKIDEPKTPYHNNSDSDQDVMSPQQKSEEEIALDASLERAKQNSRTNCQKRLNIAELNARLAQELSRSNQSREMEDEQQQANRKRAEQFKKKRAQHYNQFKSIQQMRHPHWQQQDD